MNEVEKITNFEKIKAMNIENLPHSSAMKNFLFWLIGKNQEEISKTLAKMKRKQIKNILESEVRE